MVNIQPLLDYHGLKWVQWWSEHMIEDLRMRLEAPGLDIDTTNHIRGGIQIAKMVKTDAERVCASDHDVTLIGQDTL